MTPMHNIFIPQVFTQKTPQLKGLAMCYPKIEDVESLGCTWYYNWSLKGCGGNFVPMAWNGDEVPTQETGYLLFLNEPENTHQCNLSVDKAVQYLRRLRSIRPHLKLIVGGCGYFGRQWMVDFRDRIADIPITGWHIHGYIEGTNDLNAIRDYWTYIRKNFSGELWITEFADVYGAQLDGLLSIIHDLDVARYAYFANRLTGKEHYYPKDWPQPQQMALFDSEGRLTPLGIKYQSK